MTLPQTRPQNNREAEGNPKADILPLSERDASRRLRSRAGFAPSTRPAPANHLLPGRRSVSSCWDKTPS